MINSADDVREAIQKFGLPMLLKARKQSYDGRGNYLLKNEEDIADGIQKLGSSELYAEKFVPFVKEISVMVSVHSQTDSSGSEKFYGNSYPVVETIQSDNICNYVLAPAKLGENIRARALDVATRAATCFRSRGIFGVEMFLLG